jgi:hypothetical protein
MTDITTIIAYTLAIYNFGFICGYIIGRLKK